MTGKTHKSGRIVVAGSLNADLTMYCERLPLPGETVHGHSFAIGPGGKSANQAVAASKLGSDVSLIGAVGDDPNGAMLLRSATSARVDASYVRKLAAEATGVAIIAVDAAGENNIIISLGANGSLSPSDIVAAQPVFQGAAVVCLCLEVGVDTVEAAALAGREAGAAVLLNLSPYAEVPDRLIKMADVLLLNSHEAALLLGSEAQGTRLFGMPGPSSELDAWEPVRQRFSARGMQRVVVTLGAHGSVILDSLAKAGECIVRIDPVRVAAIDTTGAGDAFTGALAARIAAGESLVEAATFASISAALSATRKGTQAAYPTLDDVRAMEERRGKEGGLGPAL